MIEIRIPLSEGDFQLLKAQAPHLSVEEYSSL